MEKIQPVLQELDFIIPHTPAVASSAVRLGILWSDGYPGQSFTLAERCASKNWLWNGWRWFSLDRQGSPRHLSSSPYGYLAKIAGRRRGNRVLRAQHLSCIGQRDRGGSRLSFLTRNSIRFVADRNPSGSADCYAAMGRRSFRGSRGALSSQRYHSHFVVFRS